MLNSFTQNINENVIYRKTRQTIFHRGSFNTYGLYEKIINDFNRSEKIYSFPNNDEKTIYVYNKNKYNPFFMHDEQMYFLFQKISFLVKETCAKYEFSYSKNKYFINASVVDDQDPSFWYDAGGTSRPSMFGIVSLDLNKTNLSINGTDFEIEPGGILISEAGSKITYSSQFKSIVFYVSPLSEINNQYSQKWIPLV